MSRVIRIFQGIFAGVAFIMCFQLVWLVVDEDWDSDLRWTCDETGTCSGSLYGSGDFPQVVMAGTLAICFLLAAVLLGTLVSPRSGAGHPTAASPPAPHPAAQQHMAQQHVAQQHMAQQPAQPHAPPPMQPPPAQQGWPAPGPPPSSPPAQGGRHHT